MNRLLPEWTPIDAVILAWPHAKTDWAPWLQSVINTYVVLINEINATGAGVVLLCPEQDINAIKNHLPATSQVLLVPAEYNDTWVRDYAFLTCQQDNINLPVEFIFNGWVISLTQPLIIR